MATDVSFTLIGSGAVRTNLDRGGPAQIVRVGDRVLLFDCGRCAVHNLARFGVQAQEVTSVFLTHLHFDHVCDLAHLILLSWNNGRRGTLEVYGPPGTADFLEYGLRRAYAQDIQSRLAHGKDPAGLQWTAIEVGEEDGPFMQEGGIAVSAWATQHAGMPSLIYRLDVDGKRIVITGDTQPDEGGALDRFCRGADLLVCECSGTSEFLATQPWGGWHMTPKAVARLAREAGVKRVVFKHTVIEDWVDDPLIADKMAESIRKGYAGEVTVGVDGLQIDLKA